MSRMDFKRLLGSCIIAIIIFFVWVLCARIIILGPVHGLNFIIIGITVDEAVNIIVVTYSIFGTMGLISALLLAFKPPVRNPNDNPIYYQKSTHADGSTISKQFSHNSFQTNGNSGNTNKIEWKMEIEKPEIPLKTGNIYKKPVHVIESECELENEYEPIIYDISEGKTEKQDSMACTSVVTTQVKVYIENEDRCSYNSKNEQIYENEYINVQ